MTEASNLIISLGTMNTGEEELKLEKLVEDGREKTFGKIFNYLIDAKEDSLNPAYNSNERELRDRIKGWSDNAQKGKGGFDLMYVKANGNYSEPVGLDESVGDFNDIVRQKIKNREFGEELRYDGVDLVARFEPVGG